jgi:hypothetical protein
MQSTDLIQWETALLSNPKEAISLIQAAFLGQVFGLLSGVRMVIHNCFLLSTKDFTTGSQALGGRRGFSWYNCRCK